MNASAATAVAPAPVKMAATVAEKEEEKTQVQRANLGHPSPSIEVEQDATIVRSAASDEEKEETSNENPAAPALAPAAHTNGETKTVATVAAKGLTAEQALEIRSAIQAQQKFLGELVEHGHRWELEGAELRIFFATEKRPFAEMVEGRESLEKIRATASKVLNRAVRVCAKIESVAGTAAPASRAPFDSQELRAKFERDPMVRSMLQRFGGKISEVKRREEGL
jgi:hypothetical protein